MPRARSSAAIQKEIDTLHPEVVRLKAAQDRSQRAVDRVIDINARNYAAYSPKAIQLANLQTELIDALAREQ